MIPSQAILILSTLIFAMGVVGVVINRRNVIILLVCVELVLLAANTSFINFSNLHQHIGGEVFVFFILAVAAVESAIGLAIIVLLYRNRKTIDVDELDVLKG